VVPSNDAVMPSARCLVVDDEPDILDAYRTALAPPLPAGTSSDGTSRRETLRAELFGNESAPAGDYSSLIVSCCRQGQDAVALVRQAMIENDPFAVIFLDIRMPPGIDGLETAQQIRTLDTDVNIVIVTGFSDYGAACINKAIPPLQNLLFFHKPIRADELKQLALALSAKWLAEKTLNALTRELESRVAARTEALAKANAALLEEVVQHRQTRDKLVHQARHDHLTGLPNRFAMQEHMASCLLAGAGTGAERRYACLLLDLDNFKQINDSRGHAAGDTLLQAVATRLRATFPESVFLARLGGDEFALFTHLPVAATNESFGDRSLDALCEPVLIQDTPVHVTASIGVSESPDHGTSPETLLRCADLAMYEAKRRGGRRVLTYSSGLGDQAVRTMGVEMALRADNVLQEEFHLVGQPIVDRVGRIGAVEILSRWHNERLGTVSPAEFIPLAEDRDLIGPIGRWVLDSCFRLAAGWAGDMASPPRVFANITMKELLSEDLPEFIAGLHETYGVPCSAIGLEISERSMLSAAAGARACLNKLQSLGIILAIDDFGAGCSGLGYLVDNPFDVMKIDQAITRSWRLSQKNRDFIKALLGLGSDMNMLVIAEGVESEEDWDFLISSGCDRFQGFHIGHPMLLDELMRHIRIGHIL